MPNLKPGIDPTTEIVEERGKFKLRYGYNSSMDFLNVLGTLEERGTPAEEVLTVMQEMALAKVPASKLANYFADYYELFGW